MSKRWIVLGFGGVAIIFSFTGIALPHWATYYHGNVGTTHFGLWRKCNAKDDCTQYPDDCKKYIEDIQVFGVNMSFISLSEVKKIYIS